jgi:formylglycine-generating enzyme required for sulfatase activity
MGPTNEPTVTIEIAPGVPLDFVLVRPGVFIMGDAQDGDNDEKPEHRVRITQPFYLGRYPVTQAQWRAVMGGNPANFTGDDQRPVESVSWEDIVGTEESTPGFLARLSPAAGYTYRLPTEAEWEYAAKGGHLAPPVEVFSGEKQVMVADRYPTHAGGEDFNAAAWQRQNNLYSTLRTGYRQPNVLGLYGMSGNVYEWCRDTFYGEAYAKRTENQQIITDPLVEESGRGRVVRGGSWLHDPGHCRSAYRGLGHPSDRYRLYGFRLVLSPSSGSEGGGVLEPGRAGR